MNCWTGYGDAPKSVLALLDVALLRAAAAKVGITEITQKEARVRFALGEVDLKQLSAVCGMKKYHSRLRLDAGAAPALTLVLPPKADVLEECAALVDVLLAHPEKRVYAAKRTCGRAGKMIK